MVVVEDGAGATGHERAFADVGTVTASVRPMNTSTALVDVRGTTRLRRLLRSARDAEGVVVAAGTGSAQLSGVALAIVGQAASAARRLRDFVVDDVGDVVDVEKANDLAGALRESPRSFVRFLRQGVELVRAVQSSARDVSDAAVDGFCEAWLGARSTLIDQLTVEPHGSLSIEEPA